MKLPASWQIKRLEKLVQFSSGGTPSKAKPEFWQGDIPWISAATMHQQEIVTSDLHISEYGLKAGSKLAKENDLLLLVRGSMLWKKVPICICRRDVAFNQDVKALKINGKITPTYLLYWFLAHQQFLLNKVVGTGIGAGKFDLDELKALDIPLPPLSEQKAIADLLSTWDEAIEKTERLIRAKERRFRWLLRKLMTPATASSDECSVMNDELKNNSDLSIHNSELGDAALPRNTQKDAKWKKVKLGNVLSKISNGLTYDTNLTDGLPVTRIETISYGVIDFQKVGFAPNEKQTERFRLEKDDILYSHINSLSHLGKVAIYDGKQALYHGMNLLLIRCKTQMACPQFIFSLLGSDAAKKLAIKFAKRAVNQASLSTTDIKSFKFRIPSLKEQQKIAETLSSAQQEIDLLKQLADKYKTQKRGLMQKMLTGQWRIKPEIVNQYMEV